MSEVRSIITWVCHITNLQEEEEEEEIYLMNKVNKCQHYDFFQASFILKKKMV